MKKIISTIIVIIVSVVLSTVVMAATGVVTTDDLNVRDGASTSANAIGKLDKNTTVNIVTEEDNWYKIDYNGGSGYVRADYVKANEENLQNPEEDSKTTNAEETSSGESSDETATRYNKVQKLLSQTDLYVLPLLNSTKVGSLEADTEVNVISSNGRWVYIQTAEKSGWIIASKLTTAEVPETEDDLLEKEETKTAESETSKNTTTENATAENKVAENTVETNTVSDSSSYPVTMKVTADSVNIRKSASTSSEVISGTTSGATLKVIGKEGDWYKVDTEDGVGYIKAEFLSK